jgi:hypothetical protein
MKVLKDANDLTGGQRLSKRKRFDAEFRTRTTPHYLIASLEKNRDLPNKFSAGFRSLEFIASFPRNTGIFDGLRKIKRC